MRHWGLLVTSFYALVVTFLLAPFAVFIAGDSIDFNFAEAVDDLYIGGWIWIAALVTGQALLMALSVDASRRRLTPRRRIAVAIVAVTLTVGLLTGATIGSVIVVALGDDGLGYSLWLVPAGWAIWGVIFYVFRHGVSASLDQILRRLMKGSLLELLIVLPCHIFVRQRDDCCAPGFTGLGIATGIAVMLMSFGPGIYLLYQKRLSEYPA